MPQAGNEPEFGGLRLRVIENATRAGPSNKEEAPGPAERHPESCLRNLLPPDSFPLTIHKHLQVGPLDGGCLQGGGKQLLRDGGAGSPFPDPLGTKKSLPQVIQTGPKPQVHEFATSALGC